jgi:hypothetical protein
VKTFYDFFYPDDPAEKALIPSIYSDKKDKEEFFTTSDPSAISPFWTKTFILTSKIPVNQLNKSCWVLQSGRSFIS